jgi:diguanylate cyclase (GGDEF)-like protein/PAS domain S-box-containing protein
VTSVADNAYADLFLRAACGLLSLDDQDRITHVNATFAEWSGFDAAALIGRSFPDLLTASSQLFYGTRYQPVLLLEGEVREVALSITRADGESLAVLVNARTITDADGSAIETRLAVFDSTQRQDYEQELLGARRLAESSESRVRVLQRASTLFLAAETEDSLAVALAQTAREAFAAADAAVVLFSPDGVMRIAAGAHLEEMLGDLRVARTAAAGDAAPGLTVISNLDEAAALSPAIAEVLDAHRFRALSGVTLFDGTTVIGALICFYGRERVFDEASLELHKALARQAALIVVRTRLQDELQQLAMHDQLTGLANRNLLRERLSHAAASSERRHTPSAIIFLDLDGFKIINDQLGHRVGDAVLHTVAARINSVIREADIAGRYGGDEFLIICEDADADAARHVADRVRDAVREAQPDLPAGYSVTASVGVVVFQPGESNAPTNDALVRLADAAMYASKSAGGDRVTFAPRA